MKRRTNKNYNFEIAASCTLCFCVVFMAAFVSIKTFLNSKSTFVNETIQIIDVVNAEDNEPAKIEEELTNETILMVEYKRVDQEKANDIREKIIQKAEEHGLSKVVAFALVDMESNFNSEAKRNGSGNDVSRGLTQITPLCLEEYNKKSKRGTYEFNQMLDVEKALEVGFWYISFLMDRYDHINSEEDAIIAYNVGPSKLRKMSSTDKKTYNSQRNKIYNKWQTFYMM